MLNNFSKITLVFDEDIDSCENMFKELDNIKQINLSKFETSKVTSMRSMFEGCSNLENIYFGKMNTSSVKYMEHLFHKCKKLEYIDVSTFDTTNVINMNHMFSECNILSSIDVSNFRTTNVIDMEDLFSYCYKLVSIDLSNFDTSNVQNMRGMFYKSNSLKYLDLRNFDGSSVTNMRYTFTSCSSLMYLNLKNFKILNDVPLLDTFTNVPTTAKYCIENTFTKNHLIGDKSSDCSDICFQEKRKFDFELDNCTCNENYKFEYNNICNSQCPNLKIPIMKNNEYICVDTIPENFYLDNNAGIYKECYNKCKKCSQEGNEAYNNCDECIDSYIFLNDFFVIQKNCYIQCNYYYYFNNTNEYTCTRSNQCTLKYNKTIEQKKKCIDECKNDNEYKYEYNNICFNYCPESTKTYEDEKLCLDECYTEQFEYNNNCYNDCPPGAYRLYLNKNICVDIIPENYYLDNNDGIYKECYYKCKKCSQGGNETYNNCDECIDGYDFSVPQKNCFNYSKTNTNYLKLTDEMNLDELKYIENKTEKIINSIKTIFND